MTPPRVSPVLRTTSVYAYTRPATGAWPVGVSVDVSKGGAAVAWLASVSQADAQRHRDHGRAMRWITPRRYHPTWAWTDAEVVSVPIGTGEPAVRPVAIATGRKHPRVDVHAVPRALRGRGMAREHGEFGLAMVDRL